MLGAEEIDVALKIGMKRLCESAQYSQEPL